MGAQKTLGRNTHEQNPTSCANKEELLLFAENGVISSPTNKPARKDGRFVCCRKTSKKQGVYCPNVLI